MAEKKTGRPAILTPEIQKTICDAIAAGGFIETAVTLAGVSKAVFYQWMKKGNKERSGTYRDFVDAVKKALAAGETRYVAFIAAAAKGGNWYAAAWMLERRFRERWAKTSGSDQSSPASTGGRSSDS